MHPLAWWAWALGLVVAITRTTDPLVVGLLLAAVVVVVLTRRDDSPWARAFPSYLVLAGAVVVLRVVLHVVVGIKVPGPVLLDLPRVALPPWAVGVELFGPITVPGVLGAASAGVRLATLLVCFGAANALANPKRALRCLPASLHHLGTAVVIAVSVTPQLATSAAGVRRAQRLRGRRTAGVRAVLSTGVPVLTDALDRSLALAASMDSRGYARTLPGATDRRVGALLLASLLAGALGVYALLAGGWLGAPVLVLAAAVAALGSVLAGRQVNRSRYRPDRWGPAETLVAGCGLAAGVVLVAAQADAPRWALAALLASLAVAPAALGRRATR